MCLKYFYIDNIKFNYDLEFDILNPKNRWKLNAPLIEYLETLGITIPHYCYHKNLSIAGNCRMCLIELKKSPKPIVSCAMNAKSSLAANIEIYTNSPLVKKARENIMEFLLLNHPLDCPICDQGGECDLQDQSLFFGIAKKRFYNFRRVVINKNIGPIVKTVMTRCIHCTRCVRFATEIAGIQNLGVFGRGVHSEIGTYINQIFQSELSGNIIDICPVGALTSKPYPFNTRTWELKTINSIDFSDGFGLNIQIFLKNNNIIKILPGYNSKENNNSWISNKTRFAFDGMFTSDRKVAKTITSGKNKVVTINTWEEIFESLIYTIYFYDHLNRHFFKTNQITFIIDENVSLETINLLHLILKKFSFFKIKKINTTKLCNDFEANLQISNATNDKLLQQVDVCLLIGTNPRYEGTHLNLKLKKRVSQGNFKLFTFNNLTDLTFPAISLGNNFKTLKAIIEGNHFISQDIKGAKQLLVVFNSNIFGRHDAKSITNLIDCLKKNTTAYKNKWDGVNFIRLNLNSAGLNLISNCENLNYSDLKSSSLLYFINVNLDSNKLKKLIDLNLLNYKTNLNVNNIIIEQSNKKVNNFFSVLKSYKHYYFPNNVFFENTESFINTEGTFKKAIKIVSSKKNTKDDNQLLRKLYSMLNKINYINQLKCNQTIQFNTKNSLNLKNFTRIFSLNTTNLSKLSYYVSKKNNQSFNLINTNFNQTKQYLNNTMLKKIINDFYIDSNDLYTKHSPTMIDCSNQFRKEMTSFEQHSLT